MENTRKNFIEEIIDNDGKEIITRFPPEPNGYLHIGHAKSICLNFGLGEKYNRPYNLRFDDTNPAAEDSEYVNSIIEDVKWLGFKPTEIKYTSDYFDFIHDCAITLIKKGLAYVDDSTSEEIAEMKGTPTEPGVDSPFKSRSVEENLDLFERMKNGEFEEGSKVLRANIDMSSSNMILRDPVLYRIINSDHHHVGDKWKVYPMYDMAHPLGDYMENITHSICTLEFEVHRPLYEWVLNNCDLTNSHPKQIEFARLNITNNIMSKRKLLELVKGGLVDGWDDPRMPTISGLRRRGYTPESIKNFCERVGVARRDSLIDYKLLEFSVREDLNKRAMRIMGVMNPLKVTITNYPEGEVEFLEAKNNPEDETMGTRMIPFSRNLYIEKEDFMENAPRKFFRLSNDKEVRFKYAYYITCNEVIKDENGEVIELKCTYDPTTKGGWSDDGRKIKGTLHWVSADHCIEKEVRLYDKMYENEDPGDSLEDFNHNSLEVVSAKLEPEIDNIGIIPLQFERIGYFIKDSKSDSINRTVSLRENKGK
ncbi:MAG: Glutamine--tRNA ligase [uncultured marine phage]|uniref:glutamine--tRNA ligase n=1 Tax=uncultured marine phage TaxID=707152 RepID=A0A8D9FQE7_9VIRU|nr:MAG: Glutamine--tRNA ligase [uncultured marine phage]